MFDYLALHGPATSAILARALDLNTGATSYHLRELAKQPPWSLDGSKVSAVESGTKIARPPGAQCAYAVSTARRLEKRRRVRGLFGVLLRGEISGHH